MYRAISEELIFWETLLEELIFWESLLEDFAIHLKNNRSRAAKYSLLEVDSEAFSRIVRKEYGPRISGEFASELYPNWGWA